ncbi:hypothetical protein GCM10023238_29870 [Streptomyces heliomycini]
MCREGGRASAHMWLQAWQSCWAGAVMGAPEPRSDDSAGGAPWYDANGGTGGGTRGAVSSGPEECPGPPPTRPTEQEEQNV